MADGHEAAPVDIPGLTELTLVGTGGFAAVYRASQPAFQRTVAVKILSSPHLDERSRDRFSRECRAMGSLSEHPNIVTLHDAGFAPDGRAYLVMAYFPGGSIADRISRAGALGWEEATTVGLQVAGALAAAHRSGVLHRDIKPANVLLSRYGSAHLADFGIARLADDSASQGITATLAYAAPEVLAGAAPSPSSDLYSLGAMLYEIITGKTPHAANPDEVAVAWIKRIIESPAPELHSVYAPTELGSLIQSMLEPEPGARPASASAVESALKAVARSHRLDGAGGPGEDDTDHGGQPLPQPAPPPQPAPEPGAPSTILVADPGATPAPPTPPVTPAPPPAGYAPTHRVALTGARAWVQPDPNAAPVTMLDPWLDVLVLGWHGAWAQVRCSNGWVCWVESRLLQPYQ